MIEKKFRIERWAIVLLNLIWIGATLYYIISDSPSSSYQDRRFSQQLDACKGSFSERYDCKSALTNSRNAAAFSDYLVKGMIVVVPPLLLWALHSFSIKRRKKKEVITAARHHVERVEKKVHEREQSATNAADLLEMSNRQVAAFLAETEAEAAALDNTPADEDSKEPEK